MQFVRSHRAVTVTVATILVTLILSCLSEVGDTESSAKSAPGSSADLINDSVTVPDSPGVLNYAPTSMSELQAADPGAGMFLIDPPQPGPMGDAQLSYPFDLPPGRNGVQPDLGIIYSSSGGNGWLGMGWDLPFEAITVDTRWGVPRYDALKETETYLLNGDQLTPLAHRGTPQPREAEREFHTRVEGMFRKIIRHGDNCSNYWWEVIDKQGTRFFYGGDPSTGGPVADSTLTDPVPGSPQHIYKWALREIRDTHGNTITYNCVRETHAGLTGGAVAGVQLYLNDIHYTGFEGDDGPYAVRFIREGGRPDVMIDCRGGFKVVTAHLLKRVEIFFQGEPVRQYELTYQEGAFQKSLLASITQFGESGKPFHTHSFEYFDDIRQADGGYKGFAPAQEWNTQDDHVGVVELEAFGQGNASAVSGAVGFGAGGHIYVGFNPATPTKDNSVGGKLGYNFSQSDGILALVDINGDNLPDKVFKDGAGFFFRANQSGPGVNASTDFGAAQPISTLPHISRERSNTLSGGAEAYVSGANVHANQAITWTNGSIYFSDANGDGLLDLVDNSAVLFNHLNTNSTPVFTPNSANTPIPIGPGAVDATDLLEDFEDDYQQAIDDFPLHDTIRRWTAPYDGQISIAGDVTLLKPDNPEPTDDGVRIAIQHNGSELWFAEIDAGDQAPMSPAGVTNITVDSGDRIYFRVQSVLDGSNDRVDWDPTIVYMGVPSVTDVNLLNPYHYRASEDFVLAGRPGIGTAMPFDGTVRLEGLLSKHSVTTDDVTLEVVRNGALIHTETLAWDATGDIDPSFEFAVAQGDLVEFRVRVDSSIDLKMLEWIPRLFYVDSPEVDVVDSNGNYIVQLDPPFDVDFYPFTNLGAPQAPWVATETGTLKVTTNLDATFIPLPPPPVGTVTFAVKRPGELLAKRSLNVNALSVDNVTFEVDVTAGDVLYFDYSIRDPELAKRVFGSDVQLQYDLDPTIDAPAALHFTVPTSDSRVGKGLFGMPYRGWAYVGYNGNRARATLPIDEALLVLPDDPEDYDITTADAYTFSPIPKDNQWRGPDDSGWVAPGRQSSSRLGADQIDVPRPEDYAGARAVKRLTRTFQTTAGGGFSIASVSATVCPIPPPISRCVLDYLDLNGDRFPDIVGVDRVQYTDAVGGLEPSSRSVSNLTPVRRTRSATQTLGLGGNPAIYKSNAQAQTGTSGKNAPRENRAGNQMIRLGVAGSAGIGHSETDRDLVDINGDGLPDRVSTSLTGDQLTVAFNLGYRFAPEEPWGQAAISQGANVNAALSGVVGFNSPARNYSYAGGASLTLDESRANQTLIDINGDGLPDRITPSRVLAPYASACLPAPNFLPGDYLLIAINTGAGFSANEVVWDGADVNLNIPGFEFDWSPSDEFSVSQSVSLGGGAYVTIPIGPLCVAGCYIILNPGGDANVSLSRQKAALIDINGDTYLDHVTSTEDGSMSVALNPIGRTNLLKRVRRPLGANIELDYSRDGNTTDDPESRWVLSRVEVYDGFTGDGVDKLVTTCRYEAGKYNRNEREFYGYGTVVEEHRDHSNADALYRTITRQYLNGSYYDKGLMERETLQDAAGSKFTEKINTYRLIDVGTGAELANSQSTIATAFPQLIRTDQLFYEGQSTPGKQTFTTYEYDALGNVTQIFDAADIGAQDDITADITYFSDAANYIVGIPNQIVVSNNGLELRRREATVEPGSGDQLQSRRYLQDGSASVTDFEYFPDGSLRKVVGPTNLHGERYELAFEYDPATSTHVTRIEDSFGYVSTASYNLLFGKENVTTDVNGQQIDFDYDTFGRVIAITGPYETGGGTPTLRFDYHHTASVPWALTRHVDSYRDMGDPIDTVLFTDGLKRILQIKKDGTVHTGPDSAPQDVMVVSGRENFDFVGRAIEQYYPTTEPLGTPGAFNSSYDSIAPTRTVFDVLNRSTRITIPDNTSTGTAYGFGLDRGDLQQFTTTITDAKNMEKHIYQDVRGLTVGIREENDGGAETLWASYEYDPIMQLERIEDDHHNVTQIAYDNFGRMKSIDNPDTGKVENRYDLADNLIAKVTANLLAAGSQISYDYEFNRLIGINYPLFPGNNVAYTYGGPGAAFNRAGRVVTVTDDSGQEERFYGKLGEVVKEIKTIASDTQGNSPNSPEVYTTEYTYDTWGRLQQLKYPDDEVLTYQYDSGGLLRAATGTKGAATFPYIQRLEYDRFAQRVFMQIQNNVRTTYTYDPLDRRLTRLTAGKVGVSPFQDLFFTYDDVGNILQTNNDVAVPPPNEFGGPVLQNYVYDELYRLTTASGTHQYAPNKHSQYSLAMAYDTIHNIVSKDQVHQLVRPSGQSTLQHQTTYNLSYVQGGARPHAPTHIGEQAFTYDANGNQLGWTHDRNGTRRDIVWDEENRIQSIADNGHTKTYKYDDSGERVIKRGPQGETVYVNPYFTVRNRTVATTHVYAGSMRVASKVVPGFGRDRSGNGPPEENFLYFCHPDHLGSASYITDIDGELYEHLQYFPFGEIWVEESSNTQRTPYLYTSKELDEETELYNYGARSFDPAQSQWLSPDPAWADDLTSMPAALSVYGYSQQNPILFTDPDGRDATVSIQGTNITVKANIYIWGNAANDKMAKSIQANISRRWNRKLWTYDKPRGPFGWFGRKRYQVRFDVNVEVRPDNKGSLWTKNLSLGPRGNVIEVKKVRNPGSPNARSAVAGNMIRGTWISNNERFGETVAHEFGHLLGLGEKYTDTGGADTGWKGNIMSAPRYRRGKRMPRRVDQRNINELGPHFLNAAKRNHGVLSGREVFKAIGGHGPSGLRP